MRQVVAVGVVVVCCIVAVAVTRGTAAREALKEEANPFAGTIIMIGGAPGTQPLHYEHVRFETIAGKVMMVGEQVLVSDGTDEDKSHLNCGLIHYVPWETVGAVIVCPPERINDLYGERMHPSTESEN